MHKVNQNHAIIHNIILVYGRNKTTANNMLSAWHIDGVVTAMGLHTAVVFQAWQNADDSILFIRSVSKGNKKTWHPLRQNCEKIVC